MNCADAISAFCWISACEGRENLPSCAKSVAVVSAVKANDKIIFLRSIIMKLVLGLMILTFSLSSFSATLIGLEDIQNKKIYFELMGHLPENISLNRD